ncbi:MAG: hypothetical protein WA874_00085 [Chryseosolibacter sp.]
MQPKIYQQNGFYHTLLVVVLVTAVALVTHFRKDLFVHETGNIRMFGSLGIVLAFGLFLKWRNAREILLVFSAVILVILILITFLWDEKFAVSYAVLSGVVAVITWLLKSNHVKQFTNGSNRR